MREEEEEGGRVQRRVVEISMEGCEEAFRGGEVWRVRSRGVGLTEREIRKVPKTEIANAPQCNLAQIMPFFVTRAAAAQACTPHAAHGPSPAAPHPSGLQPPASVTGAGPPAGSGSFGSQAHLPVKDEKNTTT
ncbi:transducin-like enhancer protein 3-B isoform X13 [Lates japonicus]|uniref:Transducin-like enhancer protein 3-B isoform X13 n=1 Tax=Lates japonicus TaxID=270547 RepID=A0AAD3MKN2_LATJO|nr:transducin-like enhancer protein 3-B isoform X13 [Lates japonicus]